MGFSRLSLLQMAAVVLLTAWGQIAAALSLSVEFNPGVVRVNQTLMAKLTVGNDSGSTATNVVVQALVPSTLSVSQSYSLGGATCPGGSCNAGEYLSWNLGTLGAGRSITVSVPMTVFAGTANGTSIVLATRLLENAIEVASVTKTAVVDNDNALTLAVDRNRDAVQPGELLTYSVVYGNRSTASVTGTTLSLPLPAGVTFVSASGGGTLVAGAVQWNLATLQAGQSARQQVVVSVGSLSSGSALAIDAATLAGTSATTGAEIQRAMAVTRVESSRHLDVALEISSDPVRSNEQQVVDLTVSNRSGGTLFGVVLMLRVPDEASVYDGASYATSGGTCPAGSCNSSELMSWNLGTLEAGGAVTVSLPMYPYAGLASGQLMVLDAVVSADDGSQSWVHHTVPVDQDNALALAVSENRDAVQPGELLTYTLAYGNRSATSTTGTTLALPLPDGVTFVSASGGGSLVGDSVRWNLATLQGGQSARQQVVVSVNAAVPSGSALVIDAATLTGNSATTGVETARATAATRVLSERRLDVALEISGDPVRSNEQQIVEITVSNRTGAAMFGVVLNLRVPDELSVYDGTYATSGGLCPAGSCNSAELMRWNLGTLAAGTAVTVALPVYPYAGLANGELVKLNAMALADDGTQSWIEHAVPVDQNNTLSLLVSENRDAVQPGELLTYTLLYGNRSTGSTTGTTLSLPLPTGVTFVSASGGGTLVGNVVQWNLATLQGGQSARQQVVVSVNADVASGTALSINAATLSGTSAVTGPELARATTVTRVHTERPLDIGVAVSGDPVRSNEQHHVALTVSNRSGVAMLGVVLQLRVTDELSTYSGTGYATGGGVCPGGSCNSAELMTWNLGTLAAGSAVTVTVPVYAYAGLASGKLARLDAVVFADDGTQSWTKHALSVDQDHALSLSLADSRDAVAPGQVLMYTLVYGNRSASAVTGTTLSLPLPAGVTFLSASGGGALVGNTVQWTLGSLAAGSGGRHGVAVRVNNTLASGTSLPINAASIQATSATTGSEIARATATTRVIGGSPLALRVVANPLSLLPNQTVTTTLNVTNTGPFPLFGVTLQMTVPDDASVSQAQITGGGTCPGGSCNGAELITWNLGTVAAGASTTVTVPGVVFAGTTSGRQIALRAEVRADTGELGKAATHVLVGSAYSNNIADTEGDGVPDLVDNCTLVANSDQRDTNNDGYGNRCDADLDNNGFVNFIDLGRFNAAFGTTNADANLDGLGVVNFIDLGIFNSQFGRPPGPSALVP